MDLYLRSALCLLTIALSLSSSAISSGHNLSQQGEAAQSRADEAYREAIALREKGDLVGTVERLKIARELYHQARNSKAEANTLRKLAEVVYLSGREHQDEVLSYLYEALSLDRARDDREDEGRSLFSIGLVLYKSGNKRDALRVLEEALPKLSPGLLGNSEGELYTTMADCYFVAGDNAKAIASYQLALNFWQGKDQVRVALITEQLGNLCLLLKNNSEASNYLNKAQRLWHDLKNERREAQVFLSLAMLSQRLGDYVATLVNYEKARETFHALGLTHDEGATLSQLGSFFGSIGDEQRARRNYLEALRVLRQTQGNRVAAWTNVRLASSYYLTDDFTSGRERLRDAINIFRTLHDEEGIALALFDLGIGYANERDFKKAVEALKESLEHSLVNNDVAAASRTMGQLGRLYAQLHEPKKAMELIDRQVALNNKVTNPSLKAFVLLEIGISYSSLDSQQEALPYYRQALDLFRSIGDRKGASDALAGIALAQKSDGKLQQALESYLQSISTVEEMGTTAYLEELQSAIAGQNANNYQNAISLAIELNHQLQAFDLSERSRARGLLNHLANARINPRRGADPRLVSEEQALRSELSGLERQYRLERSRHTRDQKDQVSAVEISRLQDKYDALLIQLKASNPEYVSLRRVAPLPLSEIQKALDQDTTLVSYFINQEKTQAFLITKSSFQAFSLSVSESELAAAVKRFRGFADTRNPDLHDLEALYESLVKPLKPYLKTSLVGVVPHGVLHYLPFAALTNGKTFFGEEHKLFYLPSASVLPFIQKKQKAERSGLLSMSQGQLEGTARLTYANVMATEVAKLYQTTALLGSNASETALRSRAGGSGIVLVAAHGELNTLSPLFSRIMLASDAENDGMLEVHEVYLLDLKQTDLVVLSSCQTQLGPRSRGEDIVALNRAFIYAGTPTVVASLWSVEERATSELMIAFFQSLKRGVGKVGALQAAQAQTRRKYPSPYYWAGFVLTGNPQ